MNGMVSKGSNGKKVRLHIGRGKTLTKNYFTIESTD